MIDQLILKLVETSPELAAFLAVVWIFSRHLRASDLLHRSVIDGIVAGTVKAEAIRAQGAAAAEKTRAATDRKLSKAIDRMIDNCSGT